MDAAALRIEPLNHQDPDLAQRIHAVLLPAYAQEALLLGAREFGPLERTPQDICNSRDFFLGAHVGAALAGVLCIGPDDEPGQISISTLVVHPAHQRRGIGRALMQEALRRGEGFVFSVSTGAANEPALALYGSFGFQIYRRGSMGTQDIALVKLRRPAGQHGGGAAPGCP